MPIPKLDKYNWEYKIDEIFGDIMQVRIHIESLNDVKVADIASEITANDGIFYIGGKLFEKVEMKVVDKLLLIKVRELPNRRGE